MKRGHYCRICGHYRANEKFSGRGHTTHICKDCAKLSPERRDEAETLNRIEELPFWLSKEKKEWLQMLLIWIPWNMKNCRFDRRIAESEVAPYERD